jgi:uncharacterized protein (TIGR02231 family)
MRKLSIILFLSLPLSIFAQVKENSSDSKISEVTVFFNGAQITRNAQVSLNAGTNLIRFPRLSYYIDPNSIQIEGNKNFTIVSVTHSQNYLQDGDQSEEAKTIRTEIEALQLQMDENRAMQNVLTEEKTVIDANRSFVGSQEPVTVDNMMDMSELYQTQYKGILMELMELRRTELKLNKKMQELNQQLHVIRQTNNKYTGEILVNLSAPVKTSTNLTFKYFVSQASWQQSYDVKASESLGPLTIVSKAKVVQATGEDWKDVMVTLSTGNPMSSNNVPALGTWQISGYDMTAERDTKGRKQSEATAYEVPSPAPANNESIDLESELEEKKEEVYRAPLIPVTNVSQANVNTEFKIAIPYTILSDAKDYYIEIQQIDLTAGYRYYTAPKYESAAFLGAYITDWEKHNLMPGYANVYFQNTYTGQSYFNTASVMDTIELSLGRDRSVIVERKKVKDLSKQAFIGASKKVTIGIEITVKNTRAKAITLEVEDQVPVSRNKEIEVDVLEISGAEHKKETGSLKWVFEMKPQETKTLKILYTVKFPKDRDISNL